SRFASLYSTGRTRYTISYPNDPTALALPLDNGRSLRGEDVSSAVWRSYPVPALEGYLVQPRSLALFRAEQMTSLDGAISLVSEGGTRKVVNQGSLELRDAAVVDLSGPRPHRAVFLGTVPPGAEVEVKDSPRPVPASAEEDVFHRERFLRLLRETQEDRPEDS